VRQAAQILEVTTRGKGLYEITGQVVAWVREQQVETGLLTLFVRHTSASLLVQENADPDVRTDLEGYFERLAPEGGLYVHRLEGADDMPAHLRTALTGVNLTIPVLRGEPALGTWQGIYLFEHRRGGHRRTVAMHLLG
jgi:secondary thiamine-phosphate synthase enzyme